MPSGIKETKSLPAILINLKAMTSFQSSEGQSAAKTLASAEKSNYELKLHGNKILDSRLNSARARSSSISSTASVKVKGAKENARTASQLSRSSSLLSLGASAPPLRGKKKKRREAEYAAQKLARQKQEMADLYRGTPVTNQLATSGEIIRFLYELWVPQLSANYRKDVPVTTSCRQDLKNVRKIAQTTPRRVRKLHRAKLIIETCHEIAKPSGVDSLGCSVVTLSVG
ncbi:hypothetical protein Bpfe_011372 [Biomphalaria pfeifferi]|uniref:Uncharacterized protein n=1 Tax=Biomphalaria pfeifferi TaxID=112525 RepID=A0AAD8BRK7_BIOPF|nr:hypothetical protein Bpfe_011372 [Biomphalaria pfeifferi]